MGRDEIDIGGLDELPDQGMREVTVGDEDETILLFRDGRVVHAVSGTCPHAGAPLAQGVRHGTRIVCPWHKAVFCLKTGALLEPPAVDGLTRYETRVDGERVLVKRAAMAADPERADDDRCFVIVGAGAAGAVAAQSLRELGFGGRLLLLDRDNRVPYDRTILSKYAISGESGAEKSPLQSQSYYRERGIERIAATVVRVDAVARAITCADGTVHRYDAALLAPGSVARCPELRGIDLNGVMLLRSRADADALLARAEGSARAVVLGAGFIGMEVAASLRERGLAVTVVSKDRVPFEALLGERVGAAFVTLHQLRGVEFRLQNDVVAIEGRAGVEAVLLASGERLAAELVVVGAGAEPATGGIEGIGKGEDGGVAVDAGLRLAAGLYAAGDVARFPLYGNGERIRVEHWRVAQQHGRVAARNMLGGDVRYEAVPVFWTIQYRKRLDYVGYADRWDDVVVFGDLSGPEFLAYYVRQGRVIAACGMDRDRETAALVELMAARRDWTPDELGETPSAVLGVRGIDRRHG